MKRYMVVKWQNARGKFIAYFNTEAKAYAFAEEWQKLYGYSLNAPEFRVKEVSRD